METPKREEKGSLGSVVFSNNLKQASYVGSVLTKQQDGCFVPVKNEYLYPPVPFSTVDTVLHPSTSIVITSPNCLRFVSTSSSLSTSKCGLVWSRILFLYIDHIERVHALGCVALRCAALRFRSSPSFFFEACCVSFVIAASF